MKRPAHWIGYVACLLTMTVGAQTPQVQPRPADFAMQLPLAVSGDNGVVQFRLPLLVYQQALSPGLADLRIFNAAGQPLSFALMDLARNERVRWRESAARLFPVYGSVVATVASQPQLDVRVAADGTLVSVHTRDGTATGNELNALILDLGAAGVDELLDSLQLFRSSTQTYRAELAIDGSEDLKLWDRVAQSRVDWLKGSQADQELVNDRIEVAARVGRYLRLQWLEGKPLQFERITARWRSMESSSETPLEVTLEAAPGKILGDLLYAAGPSIVATQVGLRLPTTNSVMAASIGFYRPSRPPPDSTFVAIAQGTFYRLSQGGKDRISSNIQIAPWSSSQWVVRPSEAGVAAPQLVLRWYPSTLVFTARSSTDHDRKQFTLAIGAKPAQVKQWLGNQTSIDLVAPGFSKLELAEVEQAVAGQWQHRGQRRGSALAGPSEVKITSPAWFENRSLVLWAVLIVGALVLGAMSWRLYRQMQREPP